MDTRHVGASPGRQRWRGCSSMRGDGSMRRGRGLSDATDGPATASTQLPNNDVGVMDIRPARTPGLTALALARRRSTVNGAAHRDACAMPSRPPHTLRRPASVFACDAGVREMRPHVAAALPGPPCTGMAFTDANSAPGTQAGFTKLRIRIQTRRLRHGAASHSVPPISSFLPSLAWRWRCLGPEHAWAQE